MNQSNKLLSDIVAFRTYAKYLQHLGRRESLEETINRNMQMHLEQFPKLSRDIIKAYQRVHELKVMPSMRALQFSGEAILKNPARQYNCSFLNIDNPKCFGETIFLLLSGVGVGFSVQKHHIEKLPRINHPKEEGMFLVHDSIEGWAQAVDVLMESYFYGRIRPLFDFGNIRPKGSYLVTTGAKAPGPEPLKKMLEIVDQKLRNSIGRKLSSIEIHDIVCIISDSVLAGGIRRAALISLFDRNDIDMLKCKHGEWWNHAPWRARANNSAVLPRSEVKKEEFDYIFKMCQESGSGEPGFSFTNNIDLGFNPCVTGDTKILTKDGYKRIDSLVDKNVTIWNGFEWSEVTPKITGTNQQILKIKFSDGRELKCTPYHKFHLSIDYRGNTSIVEAKDLKLRDKLIKHQFPVIKDGIEYNNDEMYTQGFYSADGVKDRNIIWLYEPKYELEKFLSAKRIGKENFNQYGTGRIHLKANFELKDKTYIPFEANYLGKLAWLSGLFDGDGCELKEGGLQLSSVDPKFMLDLQELLSTLGVNSKIVEGVSEDYRNLPNGKGGLSKYLCKESTRICVGALEIQNLIALGLDCKRLKFDKTPNRDASRFSQVIGIEELGIEEFVYCFNEPKNHTGIFNGVITGQCHEISLNSNQFCNLTSINQTGITSEKDFLNRVYAATLIGTLQASYTNFHYLRPEWKNNTEQESLLGVSFTGIADSKNIINAELLKKASQLVLEVNEKYARKLGINLAARTTTLKPEGSSSCVLSSSSGIHARHSDYYIRRIRMNKDDALAVYLKHIIPDLVEDDVTSSSGVVVSIPQQSPAGAITRSRETAMSLLNRTMYYNRNWVSNGHRSGDNKHNVSVTISVKDDEWNDLKEEMWDKRDLYSGISLLPYDNHTYKQAPFEEITESEFNKLNELVKEIDLKEVKEGTDNTVRIEQLACVGGVCAIE